MKNYTNKRMLTCKTCGAKISKRAKRCPYCGEMTPGETLSQIIIGIILGPFIAILIFVAIYYYIMLFNL